MKILFWGETNLDCECPLLLIGVDANFQSVLMVAGGACLLRRQSLVAQLLQSVARVWDQLPNENLHRTNENAEHQLMTGKNTHDDIKIIFAPIIIINRFESEQFRFDPKFGFKIFFNWK